MSASDPANQQEVLFPLDQLFVSSKVAVREVRCSSVLHRMNFGPTSEYTVNLYRGCAHACTYCYAPSLVHDERRWGDYVDAKVNAPAVLNRELRSAEKDVIFISSASDPYQPVEAKYKLTRKALGVIRKHDFPALILTRSPLVLRDLDILQRLSWARVGFSISSVSNHFFEPGVPSIEKRIDALCKLRDAGIKTWVSMAPIVPSVILHELESVFAELKRAKISGISLGMLRFIGYEASRVMFEERTGVTSKEALARGSEVMQKARDLAAKHGLDTTLSSLSWRSKESSEHLEHFL
jgi:DNA repair photolyase